MQEPERERPSIRDLYPDMTEDEAREADARVDRYLAIVLRTYRRISEDPKARKELLRLTQEAKRESMESVDEDYKSK